MCSPGGISAAHSLWLHARRLGRRPAQSVPPPVALRRRIGRRDSVVPVKLDLLPPGIEVGPVTVSAANGRQK